MYSNSSKRYVHISWRLRDLIITIFQIETLSRLILHARYLQMILDLGFDAIAMKSALSAGRAYKLVRISSVYFMVGFDMNH